MTPGIPRSATTRIEAIKGLKFLTRDRLIVHFKEDGREARRYILLPGTLQDGEAASVRWPLPCWASRGGRSREREAAPLRSESRGLRGAFYLACEPAQLCSMRWACTEVESVFK